MRNVRKRIIVAVVVIGLLGIPLGSLVFDYEAREREAQAIAAKVHGLVSIGDNIDDAIERLRSHGFPVADKVQPTRRDYWQTQVALRDSIPAPATFHYVTGIPVPYSNGTMWVIINADADGVINEVKTR